MPNRPEHTDKMKACVAKLQDTHDDSSAYAICTASLQKAGEPVFVGAAAGGAEEMRLLGDVPGHEFHGNQYTGEGGAAARQERIKEIDKQITKIAVGPNTPRAIKERMQKIAPLVQEQELHKNVLDPTRPQAILASSKLTKRSDGGYDVQHEGAKIGALEPVSFTGFKAVNSAQQMTSREGFKALYGDKIVNSQGTRKEGHEAIARAHSDVLRTRLTGAEGYVFDDVDITSLRTLHLVGATGVVRTEMFEGREHLVVPLIALMEGVIHAMNAETPEFVPLATLQKAAATWNGRPVTLGHPSRGGVQCSANDPGIRESHGIGTIFNSRVVGTKLLQEAWIDKAKAKRLDPAMLARLVTGEREEVSVGAFVITDGTTGSYRGKPYRAQWLETIGDHLAFLPGGRGACSVEMGCGTHRAAMRMLGGSMELLGSMPDKAQVEINKPGHPAHGKKGKITSSKGDMHTVGDYGTFKQSELKAAADGEEAAELVGYNLLRTHLDTMGKAWDEASGIVNELVADETENPTETAAEEDAEEEVESARLDSVMSLMSVIMAIASQAMSCCAVMNAPEATDVMPRYGAMPMMPCPTCDGTGQVKDGKQSDCPTCDGTGEVAKFKAAAGSRHNKNDQQMVQAIHDQAQALGAQCDRANYKMLRDISQKQRERLPDADFAGKGTSFPIKKPEDVSAAASSIGRAGAGNYSTDELKANIIRIAYRKGASFVAQLPEAWKKKADHKAAANDPNRFYIESVLKGVR
jgi:hypothetical protein